ncbi:MAG: succinylglutamate desuccinylase/aspartoacylase family protein [Polyangiaceae bacterium]|nr:succinylglutamate desuccinylase/aspartoacylase family protein [Polyangiaceae bacterium]
MTWADAPRGALGDASHYPTLSAISSALGALGREGAGVLTIGASVEHRPLFALALGPATRDTTLVVAGLHPLEWIGVAVALGLARALSAPGAARRRVVIVALANPDGYARVERDQREGRRDLTRTNARGVDLNRNFPSYFAPRRARALPGPLGWGHGERPRSEPEVDAVCGLADDLTRSGARLSRALSLHSAGRKVLYPYGGRLAAPRDAEAHRRAATALARAFDDGYTVDQSSRWVPGAFAPGMEIDHLHDAHGALALLVECRGARPSHPRDALDPFRLFNPPDPEPVVRGLVPALARFVNGELP